jgi:transposase
MVKDIEITTQTEESLLFTPEEIEKFLQEKNSAISQLNDENSQLKMSLEEAHQKIRWFEEQIKLWRQRKFGKNSENLHVLQIEIPFNADEVLALKPEDNITTEETISYERRKKTVGRRIDTSLLPRQQITHDLEPHEKICKACHGELHKIRDEVSEQIEAIPRQLYVVEHIHPQYGCRRCEKVVSAEKEPSPIPKCMAGPSLIADVIVGKYQYHLPLYRQSKILESQRINIPDSTLGNWVMQSGESLRGLDDALASEIMIASYVQVDESPVKVLEPEKKAYMWAYLSPLPSHRLIRFRFDLTRSGDVVEKDLNDFKGLLQTDGYSGYNNMRADANVTALGCMAHARRKFADVIKIASTQATGKAHEAMKYFALLYRIEENARVLKLSHDERKSLRQNEAVPILEKFSQWLVRSKNQVPPQSAIGIAINYTLKQWDYLKKYVDYGEAEIDNNWVENEIRPLGLGKKNWLFVMHERSAQIGALYYSLIQSAKLNNLNPRIYLHYLLTQVHALRRNEIESKDLLPNRIDRQKLDAFAESEFQKSKKLFATFAR